MIFYCLRASAADCRQIIRARSPGNRRAENNVREIAAVFQEQNNSLADHLSSHFSVSFVRLSQLCSYFKSRPG